MEQKQKQSTENFIKDIRRKSRRLFSSEQKLIIVMEAQRGENSVTEICRKHGISQATFCLTLDIINVNRQLFVHENLHLYWYFLQTLVHQLHPSSGSKVRVMGHCHLTARIG